ncbi:MAG TPA: endonuclease/exonuclease/phosphatase family protein [Acidimicrobiales bacterium]|nr:endonuclease/exonuclease/phosphatase family protein [Acidimicrobiales bacterium]
MRVATWNVRHGRPRRGFASNRLLAEEVVGFDVDLLGIQEVDRRVLRSWFVDQPRLVAVADDSDAFEFAPARRFVMLTGEDGIALCVRGEMQRTRVLELPREKAAQRRVAIISDVTVGDEHTTVVTTHLHNDAVVAARQLDALLEAVDDEPSPRLLLGDLNLRPDDITATLAAARFALVEAGFTAPAWAPVQRVDHIAVDGLVAGDAAVPEVAVSDHRPIVVEVRPAS